MGVPKILYRFSTFVWLIVALVFSKDAKAELPDATLYFRDMASKIPSVFVADVSLGLEPMEPMECFFHEKTLTGIRFRCGKDYPYAEVVSTDNLQESGFGVVLHIKQNAKKSLLNFICLASAKTNPVSCKRIKRAEPVDETKIVSTILSSHPKVKIRNAHFVGPKSYFQSYSIVRGMAPRSPGDYDSLREAEIDRILIFKDSPRGDVAKEKNELLSRGWHNNDVLHVNFPWKAYKEFSSPCKKTLEALRFLRESLSASKNVYFHCTVGEDRTGFLAGLYRILTENADTASIFKEEMCERGFAWGDAAKPFDGVVQEIESSIGELFRRLVYLHDLGRFTWPSLEQSVCEEISQIPSTFSQNIRYSPQSYWCDTSTRFRPE